MSEPQIETWTFAGSRILSGKKAHRWVDADGNHMHFTPSGSPVVGGRYRVKVDRTGEKISKYAGEEYTGERCEGEMLEGLLAKHKAVEVSLRMQSRERHDKAHDPLEDAISTLCRFASHVPANQRTAFIAHVINRLQKAW